MPVFKRHTDQLRCPAAELVHPIFSLNDMDCECRIAGRMQPLEDSPCAGDYTKCAIWRKARDNERADRSVKLTELQRKRATTHVLDNAERDVIWTP